MKKTITSFLLFLCLAHNGYSQDSLKATLGLGVSVNKYLLSAFGNYTFNAGKYISKNRELGINCRYFQSKNEPGRIFSDPETQSNFFQFQSNIYLKNHQKIFNRNFYWFSELGVHYTNSISRNGNQLFMDKQENYFWPNFSLGLGTDFFFSKNKRFGIDGNCYISNGKTRFTDSGINGFLFGNFFLVPNASVTGKVMF